LLLLFLILLLFKSKILKFLYINFQILFQFIDVHEIQFVDVHQIEVK
jgi:hypothetical protein